MHKYNYEINKSRNAETDLENISTAVQSSDTLNRSIVGQPGTPITISFDGSVASASALTAGQLYKFQANYACHIVFAETPVATTAHDPIAQNVPYYYTPLTSVKVAAIKASGGDAGTLWITPITGYSG